jgi:fatty acid desaturase
MKRIYYNNQLARILLALSSCHTIMFFGFVLSTLTADRIAKTTENHEFIHMVQYWVCVAIGAAIAIPLVYFFGWWFILLPAFLYYILYVGEAAISFVHHFFSTKKKDAARAADKAYYNSAMEMEAYENDGNFEYLMTRPWWANFRYYGKL